MCVVGPSEMQFLFWHFEGVPRYLSDFVDIFCTFLKSLLHLLQNEPLLQLEILQFQQMFHIVLIS